MKPLRRVVGLFAACAVAAAALVQPAAAQELAKDPFITTHADRTHYEPGGRYHLFGSPRGSIAERSGSINIRQAYTHQMGNLLIQQANIGGKIGYETHFSGHGHEVHAPFDNHASRSASEEKGSVAQGFTVYRLNWSGHEHHPADGYDGPQGGNYPPPKGARDIYTYTVDGVARSIKLNPLDTRSISERFRDNYANLGSNFSDRARTAHRKMLEYNPGRDRWGNAMELINGVAAGAVNLFQSGAEAVGLGDIMYGAGYAIDLATMHAISPLSADGKLAAIGGLGKLAGAEKYVREEIDRFIRENPNAAETIEAAFNVAAIAKAAKMAKSAGAGKTAKAGKADVSDNFAGAAYSRKVAEESAALKRIANNQKTASNLNNKSSGSIVREQTNRKIDAVLSGASKGRETKGKATQYEKSGGFDKAVSDFNSLGVKNVRQRENGTITGNLADGRSINVRPKSSPPNNHPTIEIQKGKNETIKIRYKQ